MIFARLLEKYFPAPRDFGALFGARMRFLFHFSGELFSFSDLFVLIFEFGASVFSLFFPLDFFPVAGLIIVIT